MVPAKNGGFGVLVNGNWSGLKGQLQQKVPDFMKILLSLKSSINNNFFFQWIILQEVDIACSAFAGAVGFDIMDLAIHVLSDSYGILVQYPVPKTCDFSHTMTFSLNVGFKNPSLMLYK